MARLQQASALAAIALLFQGSGAKAAVDSAEWQLVRGALNYCAKFEAHTYHAVQFGDQRAAAVAKKCAWAAEHIRTRLDAGDQQVCAWFQRFRGMPMKQAWLSLQAWRADAEAKCAGYDVAVESQGWYASKLQALASKMHEKRRDWATSATPTKEDIGHGVQKLMGGISHLKERVQTADIPAWGKHHRCSMLHRLQRMGMAGKKVDKAMKKRCPELAAGSQADGGPVENTPVAHEIQLGVGRAAEAFHKFAGAVRRSASDTLDALVDAGGDSSLTAASAQNIQALPEDVLRVRCEKTRRLEKVLDFTGGDIYQRRPWLIPLRDLCAKFMGEAKVGQEQQVTENIVSNGPSAATQLEQDAIVAVGAKTLGTPTAAHNGAAEPTKLKAVEQKSSTAAKKGAIDINI